MLKSRRTWSRGRCLLSAATQLHRKGAGTEVEVNKPRVQCKEDGPLLLSGRVFWQQYGVMNETGNEQSSSAANGIGLGWDPGRSYSCGQEARIAAAGEGQAENNQQKSELQRVTRHGPYADNAEACTFTDWDFHCFL